MRLKTRVLTGAAAVCLLLAGCTGAPTSTTSSPAGSSSSSAPVTLTNCGVETTFTEAPKAAVTLNQGATEVMLALGLEGSMKGTAYLDDTIPERWKTAYDSVPVLAEKYPSKEAFLAVNPDFAYASYASAFTDKNIGTRDELKGENVGTYLSPFGCKEQGSTETPATMESAWGEVTDVARIFRVEDRATKLIEDQKAKLAELKQQAAGKGRKVLWYDSGDKELFAAPAGAVRRSSSTRWAQPTSSRTCPRAGTTSPGRRWSRPIPTSSSSPTLPGPPPPPSRPTWSPTRCSAS